MIFVSSSCKINWDEGDRFNKTLKENTIIKKWLIILTYKWLIWETSSIRKYILKIVLIQYEKTKYVPEKVETYIPN